jgi:DNA-directed RNA polymerase specialized sigma24 family protein
LHLRALARAAHGAPRYRGSPPLAVWLRTCIDRSIDDLLDEDRDEERSFSLTDGELEHPYAFIADLLQCEPELARSACVAFNALPREDRRTFFAIVIERTPLVRFVAQGNGPPMKVKESLRRAFRALGLADEPWSSSEGADG